MDGGTRNLPGADSCGFGYLMWATVLSVTELEFV